MQVTGTFHNKFHLVTLLVIICTRVGTKVALLIRPVDEDLQHVGSANILRRKKRKRNQIFHQAGTKAGLGCIPTRCYPKSLPKKIFTFTFPWTLCTCIGEMSEKSDSEMLHFSRPESFYTISLLFIIKS